MSNSGLVQKVADLERRQAEDENDMRDLRIAHEALKDRTVILERQTSNYTFGFYTIAAIGAAITFVTAFWDKITGGLRHP